MNKVFKFLSVVVFLLSLTLISALDNKSNKVEDGGMNISWEIVNSDVIFNISAPTLGWVAIGFEPTKMMKDADLIIGYVSEGEVFVQDHFAHKQTGHKSDISLGGKDNVKTISGEEADGRTTITFSIPLSSGDKYDKVLEVGKQYTIIFAYGKKDNFKSIHKYRRKEVITL